MDDDDPSVHSLVPHIALVALGLSFAVWCALCLAIVVGRARYDRMRRNPSSDVLGSREARRLVRRARRPARTERGTWRRIAALTHLARANHPDAQRLVQAALVDPDGRISAAAVRVLGDLGDECAIDLLLEALHRGRVPRSRVAAQLERLAPRPGTRLLPLLRAADPAVRFWGAMLLGPYPEIGDATLIELTWDSDPNVRAAAVETLGTRSGAAVGAAVLARLDDPEWFVRVHAARSAGHVLGAEAAPSISCLLADQRWWVRTAAKDALRTIGTDAVPALLSVLTHDDAFARNGAAEVLQDVGFVDFLAVDDPGNPLLQRIYEAGGDKLRDAAEARVDIAPGRKADAA